MSRSPRSSRTSRQQGSARGRTAGAPARRGTRVRGDPDGTPHFAILDRAICEAILKRNTVGRLVYSLHDRIDVEPMHYVYDGGWLYGRTSPGTKLATLRHRPWVAFEVDEVDGVLDWRSVVVHGTFYTLDPDGPVREATAFRRAIRLLRRLIPETGTAADPVPFRSIVFRIHADEISGRSALQLRDDGHR